MKVSILETKYLNTQYSFEQFFTNQSEKPCECSLIIGRHAGISQKIKRFQAKHFMWLKTFAGLVSKESNIHRYKYRIYIKGEQANALKKLFRRLIISKPMYKEDHET